MTHSKLDKLKAKLESFYEHLDEMYMIDVRDWCDSDLGQISTLIRGIFNLRQDIQELEEKERKNDNKKG